MSSFAARTVVDMIDGRFAPLAPDASPHGWPLASLDAGECRFPVEGTGKATRFCGVAVRDWRPGQVNGCYCATHRAFLAGQANSREDG